MSFPNVCDTATYAKTALNKAVLDVVATSAIEFYADVVKFIRKYTGFDITLFLKIIAIMTVLCWFQSWLLEFINFICRIPKFIKNLFSGKVSLCFLNCKSKTKSTRSTGSNRTTKYLILFLYK